jgi:integrase
MTKFKSKLLNTGRIYKKTNIRPDGTRLDVSTWTVRYKGRDYSTGETDPKKAEQFLLRLAGDIANGKPLLAVGKKTGKKIDTSRGKSPAAGNGTLTLITSRGDVLMSELLDGLIANQKRKGNKTTRLNEGTVDLHLGPAFGAMAAALLTSSDVEKYVDKRLDDGAKPASVNRELALLKRALNIAVRRDPPLIQRRPHIEMLKVSNVRKGFLAHDKYVDLRDALPSYLMPVFVAAYHIGTRRGELLQVELRDVDMDALQFRLYPDATKNGEGRTIPIYGEMIEVFRAQIAMTRSRYPSCPWLFHSEGVAIQTFDKAWKTATAIAGVPDLLFHDLRRTAVRNLTRAGVDRKRAMDITGHKTESIFNRYDISNEEDLREAGRKMEAYLRRIS